MPRIPLVALLLLATAACSPAQQGAPQPAAPQESPDVAYAALAKAFNEAMSAWEAERTKQVQDAQAKGLPIPKSASAPPTAEFVARAEALAKRWAGGDDAVRFLTFVVKNASTERDAVRRALGTLTEHHIASPAIADVLGFAPGAERFVGRDAVVAFFGDVLAKNPAADVKAKALLMRGTVRLAAAETDADRATARADLERVAQVTQDEDLREAAKSALFELDHLQVGSPTMDIVGMDVEGAALKLSDYRGKVVLLDFWGFW
jgi:hypothetical protein